MKISENVNIAPEVSIFTGSHEIGTNKIRAGKGITYSNYIGNGVWIGGRVSIINGANIGNGVVVGACTLVNKDCIDNSLYLGVPNKKVKQLSHNNGE